MTMAFYIIVLILLFGVLIAVHEFGHFITAKLLGVRVNEFAIGMGPLLLSRQKGETQYSLRAIPIGGFCAMEGEDDDSGDPKAFSSKPWWKKFIILVAGSFMNLLTGVLIILVLFSQVKAFALPAVDSFSDWSPLASQSQLQPGDRFLSIDGHRVYTYGDASMLLGRAGDVVDLVVERDGNRVELHDFYMPRFEIEEDGQTVLRRGITIGAEAMAATPLNRIQMTINQSIDYVRMVWMGVGDLITGKVSIQDMSGPIYIVKAGADMGAQAENTADAFFNILNFMAFIAINLAVMNLLPIPALDGGRIFFLAVNGLFTLFTRKRLDPKYEGYVNVAGFFCLILLMIVVAFNDVLKLIR